MDQAQRGRGRPPAERKRTAQLRIRAYPEWAEWLTSVSKQADMDVSEIIAEGVELWARRKKLAPPPER